MHHAAKPCRTYQLLFRYISVVSKIEKNVKILYFSPLGMMKFIQISGQRVEGRCTFIRMCILSPRRHQILRIGPFKYR